MARSLSRLREEGQRGPDYRLICAFSVVSTAASNELTGLGASLALVSHEGVALGDQGAELFVQRLALRHLRIDLRLPLRHGQLAQVLRQVALRDRLEGLPTRLDVADEVAVAGDRFTGNLRALVDEARHVGRRRRRGGGDRRHLPHLVLGAALHRRGSVRQHRAADFLLQDDDLLIVRRLDDDDLAAVLRDRDETAAAELGDFAPDALGVARAAGQHRVDEDVLLLGDLQRLRILRVLRVIHVRRRIADQEDDAMDVVAVGPGELVDRDRKRLVHAFRPIAAALGAQLQRLA